MVWDLILGGMGGTVPILYTWDLECGVIRLLKLWFWDWFYP